MTLSSPRAPAVRPLGPDSLIWQRSGDRTALLGAGAALLLQVAHPAVGAGVRDHSDFLARPWDRLEQTLTSLHTQIYGGEQAIAEAARLRRMHRSITGTDMNGRRYHALDPEAYFWVHATLFLMFVQVERYFGVPLSRSEQGRAYAEWRRLGTVLGIPERVMPAALPDFHRYADRMIADVLRPNEVTRTLTRTIGLRGVPPPDWWPVADGLWSATKPAGAHMLGLTTAGLLPPGFRERLGLPWSPRRSVEFRTFGITVRRTSALLPPRVRQFPIAYRAKALARVA